MALSVFALRNLKENGQLDNLIQLWQCCAFPCAFGFTCTQALSLNLTKLVCLASDWCFGEQLEYPFRLRVISRKEPKMLKIKFLIFSRSIPAHHCCLNVYILPYFAPKKLDFLAITLKVFFYF